MPNWKFLKSGVDNYRRLYKLLSFLRGELNFILNQTWRLVVFGARLLFDPCERNCVTYKERNLIPTKCYALLKVVFLYIKTKYTKLYYLTLLPCSSSCLQQWTTVWIHFNRSSPILGAWYQFVLSLCKSSFTVAHQVWKSIKRV